MNNTFEPDLVLREETNHSLNDDPGDFRVKMSRLYYSKCYKYQHIFAAFLCVVSTIILFQINRPYQEWFYFLEVLVISISISDVVCQGIVQKLNSCKVLLNSVASLSTVALISVGLFFKHITILSISLTLAFLNSLIKYFQLGYLTKNMRNAQTSVIDMNEMSEIDKNQNYNRSGIFISQDDLSVIRKERNKFNHDLQSYRIIHTLGN